MAFWFLINRYESMTKRHPLQKVVQLQPPLPGFFMVFWWIFCWVFFVLPEQFHHDYLKLPELMWILQSSPGSIFFQKQNVAIIWNSSSRIHNDWENQNGQPRIVFFNGPYYFVAPFKKKHSVSLWLPFFWRQRDTAGFRGPSSGRLTARNIGEHEGYGVDYYCWWHRLDV